MVPSTIEHLNDIKQVCASQNGEPETEMVTGCTKQMQSHGGQTTLTDDAVLSPGDSRDSDTALGRTHVDAKSIG